MSETVFIFGAGASAAGGAPVMGNFLDVARNMWLRGEVHGAVREQFELVFQAIAALDNVYAKAEIDTDNLEAVFAAFEMAKLFGRLADLDETILAKLPDAMRTVIVETLEHSIILHVSSRTGNMPNIDSPAGYSELVDRLKPALERHKNRITFITFNYDLALDYALAARGVGVDYGLGALIAPERVLLLKLHGSVNWTDCRNCQCIVPYEVGEYLDATRNERVGAAQIQLRVSRALGTFRHCNGPEGSWSNVPVIVPPTWNKGEHHARIATIWRRAAQELAAARNIIVVGYSLPESDHFFRYLYALGTVSSTRIERFWVIDPDTSGGVAKRFESLLGSTARARFKVVQQTFTAAVGNVIYGAERNPPDIRGFLNELCH